MGMASAKFVRYGVRLAILAAACVLGFYLGRPLYWKVIATLQEFREGEHGISDLVREAQHSVGWNSGMDDGGVNKVDSNLGSKDLGDEGAASAASKDSTIAEVTDAVNDKKTKDSKDGSTSKWRLFTG